MDIAQVPSSTRRPGRGSGLRDLELRVREPVVYLDRPPVLFVHGLGHGAWCWGPWMERVAAAGLPAYALSLRGHGFSRPAPFASLGDYVDDVVTVMESLPAPPVLVGHSMGGLVVQRVIAEHHVPGAVLVASVGHRPAVGSIAAVTRAHPGDAAAMVVGRTLPMRGEYLFEGLSDAEAAPWIARCGPESPVAQLQLLAHRQPALPRYPTPVLTLGAVADRLVPIRDLRRTAARYGADLREYRGIGHDLMLDRGWEEPADDLLAWIAERVG